MPRSEHNQKALNLKEDFGTSEKDLILISVYSTETGTGRNGERGSISTSEHSLTLVKCTNYHVAWRYRHICCALVARSSDFMVPQLVNTVTPVRLCIFSLFNNTFLLLSDDRNVLNPNTSHVLAIETKLIGPCIDLLFFLNFPTHCSQGGDLPVVTQASSQIAINTVNIFRLIFVI